MKNMVKNEWWLFKQNIYALLHNRTLSQSEFALILLCLLNPLSFFVPIELVSQYIPLAMRNMYFIGMYMIPFILVTEIALRRMYDSFYGINPIVIWIAILGYFWWGQSINSILLVWIKATLTALVVFFVLPHDDSNGPLKERNPNGIVFYDSVIKWDAFWRVQAAYADKDKIFEQFYLSWIKNIFNFKGRINREDFVFSLWGYCVPTLVTVILYFIIRNWGSNDVLLTIFNAYPLLVWTWTLCTLPSLCVRRLHDSAHSALWLPLIVVPYVGAYVVYLIFFKPSWIGFEPYKKEELINAKK